MVQVPPPHFSDTVVRLIALQILAFGDSHTLELVCGGSNLFPTYEKTESMLLNLLMPLCLRVGSGRKDVHIMRDIDISYCLTVVLYAMHPPSARTPVTTQNFKMAQDFRSGSFSLTKPPPAVTKSSHQVSFLALKILIACFEGELKQIGIGLHGLFRTLKGDRRPAVLLELHRVCRPPLFTLMQPFIRLKLNMTPISEIEQHIHFVVREKIAGHSNTGPKCRGKVLSDLIREMKALKDDSHKFKSVSSVPSTITQEPVNILSKHHTSSEVLSPEEESQSESRPRPRLQRSKAQSRKTFRHRKSRMEGHRSEPSISNGGGGKVGVGSSGGAGDSGGGGNGGLTPVPPTTNNGSSLGSGRRGEHSWEEDMSQTSSTSERTLAS